MSGTSVPDSAARTGVTESPADLARLIAATSQERRQAAEVGTEVLFPEDLLPGTREEQTSLQDGLRKFGASTFVVLAVIVALDNLQSSGLSVLAPNIRSSYHVSSGAIVFVAGISGAFLVLGIVPMGWLADRFRRAPIIGVATFFFGIMVFLSGLATNIFLFFCARFGAGVSQASTQTVHASLLADTYPISLRGRIGAGMGIATGIATALSPILVGTIATSVGGAGGWRWAFYILAVPIVAVAAIAFGLREPPRGQHEKIDVLGQVIEDTEPLPPSLEAAFARILKIRTMKMCLIAFSAMGFGLFTAPVLGNLFLQQEYGLNAFRRGLIGTIGSLGVLVALPFVGRYYDRLYRSDPAKALALVGKIILPVAVLVPIQYFMPDAVLWAVFSVLVEVGFEVRRGEVLALLGTNGAGKSTALKVAAGLVTADRGVIRLNGRTITYATPEQRSRLGIHLLPGGRGTFGEMSVMENLEMGAFAYRGDRADLRRRITRVLELFPVLKDAKGRRADTLSGGQQQMLALAIALLHDPEVLMIDELSLGLAPIVVQELLEVVERLKAEGVTMVIVEQSLNVAAAVADRAVFMEKGQVRFEGAIADLLERDDLARAVFLGGEVPT